MREWINFYKYIDKGLQGGLTKFLVVFVLPLLISSIILLSGNNLMNFFSSIPLDLSDLPYYFMIAVIALNWFIIVVGAVLTMVVIAVAFALITTIFDAMKNKWTALGKFFKLVKDAKQKSFDKSSIVFNNKQQEMKIKG